jgi:hypothetical protein
LKGNKGPSEKIAWSSEMEVAFKEAKASFSRATWLAHPDPRAKLAFHVDASAKYVGAVLQQQVSGTRDWRPVGFFSKKLDPA